MIIRKYEVKRKCNIPRFLVVVTCQGQSFYYCYHGLIGAVIGYCEQYLTKKKYGTMNFKLREVLITDDFEEEYEDGTVHTVGMKEIRFLDSKQEFEQYAWEDE